MGIPVAAGFCSPGHSLMDDTVAVSVATTLRRRVVAMNGGVETVEEVVGEHPGDEFAARVEAGLGEDRLDVVADRVR